MYSRACRSHITGKMIILMAIFLAGVLKSQASSELKDLAKANNDFCIKIYKSFPSTGNAFFSPASVFTALGMLFKGAEGNTAQEMREALSYDKGQLTDNSVHQKFKDFIELLGNPSGEYALEIANALVTSDGYPISEEYKEALKTFYKAITKRVNFRGAEKVAALKEINDWVSEKTHGKIPKLVEDFDTDTVMVLLNAVYFKGNWNSEFNKHLTKDDLFYANGKDPKTVRMMNKEIHLPYEEFFPGNFKALQLPYIGEHLSMIILLPNERDGLKQLEESLTSQKLTDVISTVSGREQKVKVSIPKFKLEDSRKLVENLKQLGMKDAFKDGSADFTGIDKNGRLIITDVVHKAVIEVNEEGTEAAAATRITGIVRSSRPLHRLEFKVDHPFLFLIHDKRTEMILFMGRVNEL